MFRVEREGGFSFKIRRTGQGGLPDQLTGSFSSESEAKIILRHYLDLVQSRKDVIKDRTIAKNKRSKARAKKREEDVES